MGVMGRFLVILFGGAVFALEGGGEEDGGVVGRHDPVDFSRSVLLFFLCLLFKTLE